MDINYKTRVKQNITSEDILDYKLEVNLQKGLFILSHILLIANFILFFTHVINLYSRSILLPDIFMLSVEIIVFCLCFYLIKKSKQLFKKNLSNINFYEEFYNKGYKNCYNVICNFIYIDKYNEHLINDTPLLKAIIELENLHRKTVFIIDNEYNRKLINYSKVNIILSKNHNIVKNISFI